MNRATRPTKTQHKVLTFIYKSTKENGYSPSYREIMEAIGVSSVSVVALHVKNLASRGLVEVRPKSARSIEITQAGRRFI